MHFIRSIIIFMVFFSVHLSHAYIIPVSIIYRYDTRSPSELIAAGGFMPWRLTARGGDQDLVSHVEGTSIWTRTSAFVSASERIEGAIRTIGQSAAGPFHTYPADYRVYLYAIRPDPHNSYQVTGSLDNAGLQSQSAIVRQLYRLLDTQMNMGIYEVATLNGLAADRIISYAEVTGELLRTHALATMFAPSFWTSRWITLSSYNPLYDQNVTAAEPYPVSSMREPDGRGFFVQNVDLEQEVLPLSICCFGIWHSSSYSFTKSCNLKLKIRYLPYSVFWIMLLLYHYET